MMCHKCKYNGKGLDVCLSCAQEDMDRQDIIDRQIKHNPYYTIDNTMADAKYDSPYDIDLIEEDVKRNVTNLAPEVEDMLRKAISSIFSLKMMELLCLQAIINRKSLTELSKDIQQFASKNLTCSRQKIFQTRKSLASKFNGFDTVLLTVGQRKKLKTKDMKSKKDFCD